MGKGGSGSNARFNPLGRIAGRSYCKTGDTLHV